MNDGPNIARTAALIGDPARAAILMALMRGQALTASELAGAAGVGLSTASSHLAQLEAGRLIAARKAGRHKYFALTGEDAARVIEALMGFAGTDVGQKRQPGPRDPALRRARVCYNHLAGEQGVRLYDSLLARGFVTAAPGGLALSDAGREFALTLGVDREAMAGGRGPQCRECLDWSMRRNHLGGRVGRAFFAAIEARGWAHRVTGTRVVAFTSEGERGFAAAFPIATRAGDESLDLGRLRT